MPGIVSLVRMLSLDMTSQLCLAGYGIGTLDIVGATNASPIVLTTATAHGYVRPQHVLVQDVIGNVAANHASLDPDGTPTFDAWVAVPQSSTTLALYGINPDTGGLALSVGSGAYAGGGKLKRAFTDGVALIGRQHVFAQSAPPRVLFIPVASKWGPKSVYGTDRNYPSADIRRQNQQRSIRTENVVFEVHCWGAAGAPDPDDDFDAAQRLSQAVVQSAHRLAPGTYELTDGRWSDQQPSETQLDKLGHEMVFGLSIGTPVLGKLLPYAPDDVAANPTTYIVPSDGLSTEIGCSG